MFHLQSLRTENREVIQHIHQTTGNKLVFHAVGRLDMGQEEQKYKEKIRSK